MQWKRLILFLLINIFVSVITTLTVLTLWDRTHRPEMPDPVAALPDLMIPTATRVAPVAESQVALLPYQVGAGETLGEIALAYDISVEELLELNGLTDPDAIGTGATIFVPDPDGLVSIDETHSIISEGEVNPGDSANPTDAGQVEIVAVIGAGDLASERVRLRSLAEESLDLSGWRLQDDDGLEYIFPTIKLFGDGEVHIYSSVGVDNVIALYWNAPRPVWESGEKVTLLDNTGKIQATYTVP